jgi:polyisoprenoid-binding protein YceI
MLVVFTMVLSSVAFASVFTDVEDGAAYAEAINVNAALGLLNGYEDGTFAPTGDITRAEFAAVIVRALGQDAQAAGAAGATQFTDVPADHWASGYINIAARLGIVNGYGDGTFGPSDNVKYEQAIKMIIVALGYEPAIGDAGYPVGYLTKAGELGITNGVSGSNGVNADRGTVAQLVFNAIDVPLMIQTGFGAWVNYEVQDGYNDTTRKTLLSENLGAIKLQVTVDDASKFSTSKNEPYVKTTILNNYKSKYSEEFEIGENGVVLTVGDSAIDELVGSKAIVYALYDEASNEDPYVIYAAKDTSKTNELTLTTDQLETATKDDSNVEVSYWENPTDKKPTYVSVLGKAKVYVNDVLTESKDADGVIAALKGIYGEVTFARLDTTISVDYDTVYVTNYTNYVIDTNNTKTYRLKFKNVAGSINYDPEESSVDAKLYDENGVEMAWEDLAEWDVISCKKANVKGKDIIVAYKQVDTVSGSVTGIANEGEDDAEYTIGGTKYMLGANIDAYPVLGDEGTFYLDIMGRICAFNAESSVNTSYAYILGMAEGSDFDTTAQFKLFTFDGNVYTYNTAAKIKVDGISSIPAKDIINGDVTANKGVNDSKSLIAKHGEDHYNVKEENKEKLITGVKAITNYEIVTFKTNSNAEITEIDRAYSYNKIGSAAVKNNFREYATGLTGDYTLSSQKLGGVYLDDNTIIMVTGAMKDGAYDEDECEIYSVAALDDEQEFTNFSVYNVDEDKVASLILVEGAFSAEPLTAGFVAVASVSSSKNATTGDDNFEFVGVQDSEIAEYVTKDTSCTPAVGSIIIPKYGTGNEVKAFDLVAAYVDGAVKAEVAYMNAKNGEQNGKVSYIYGDITEINKREVTVNDLLTKEDDVISFGITSKANVYVCDMSLKNSKVDMGDLGDFTAEGDGKIYNGNDEIKALYAVARLYEGDVVDVMLYVINK